MVTPKWSNQVRIIQQYSSPIPLPGKAIKATAVYGYHEITVIGSHVSATDIITTFGFDDSDAVEEMQNGLFGPVKKVSSSPGMSSYHYKVININDYSLLP